MKKTALILALLIAGCASNPNVSPGQDLVNKTGASCSSLGAAMTALDQAVLNRAISKSTAQEALKGFTVAQAACMTSLSVIQSANPPASGATK